jgi:hypothetical protein
MAAIRRGKPSATLSSERIWSLRRHQSARDLFPQVAGSTVNPQCCWDWWGYSHIDYLDKDAPQINAIWDVAGCLAMQP